MRSVTIATTRRCTSMDRNVFRRRKRTQHDQHCHHRQQHSSIRPAARAPLAPSVPNRHNSSVLYRRNPDVNVSCLGREAAVVQQHSGDTFGGGYILPLPHDEKVGTDTTATASTVAFAATNNKDSDLLPSWSAAETVMKMMKASYYHASHTSGVAAAGGGK